MSTTTQARPPAATEDRLHSDLVKIWRALGGGPWIVDPVNPANDLHEEILAIRYSDADVRDYGACALWVSYLVSRGFLTASKFEGNPRLTVFTKAPTPPEPDRRSWVQREQAALDQAARAERQRLDQQAEFARNLAEQWATLDPAIGQISSALRRLNVIDRTGVEEVTSAAVSAAVEPLRQQLAELAQQLAAVHEELAALRESIDQTPARRFGRRSN